MCLCVQEGVRRGRGDRWYDVYVFIYVFRVRLTCVGRCDVYVFIYVFRVRLTCVGRCLPGERRRLG